MDYTSIPVYLDPPNWNQQQNQHQAGGGGECARLAELHQSFQQPAAPPPPEGGPDQPAASARPVSMADKARQAKIPQPEPALKCPRCDSTNTKFCYFNNYSLSQPRHFCKTCRRYWTRGGALRNVPVGGGCRRNKRSKSGGNSKNSSNSESKAAGNSVASMAMISSGSSLPSNNIQAPQQLPFLPSLHALADYTATSLGLSFGGTHPIDPVDYQVGINGSGINGLEQWRLQQVQQQLPFFARIEQPPAPPTVGMYPFDGNQSGVGGIGFSSDHHHVHGKATAGSLLSQLASVKMEERRDHHHHQQQQQQQRQQGLDLPIHYLGIPGSDQFWGGHGSSTGSGGSNTNGGMGWGADLSGFNSTTTGSLL